MDILSFITGCTLVSLGHCWIVKVPNTVKAVDGSCVEVSCHTAPHHRVIWYRYHSILYPKVYDGKEPTSVESSFRGRTSVPGNASEGDCTLRVESVTWTDDNLQLYVWINPDESATQNFHRQIARITIENRKAPALSMKNALVDGALFQANCTVWHSCPSSPPSLRWSRLPVKSTAVTSMGEKGGLWVSTETIQGRGTCQLHKKEMKCTAQFATVQTESQPVILNISYAPVGVKVMVDEQPVSEGHSVNLECVADSNPQPGRYVWIRRQGGQSIQTNSTQGKMSYPNISRDTSFSCIVQNNIGSNQSAWLFLDVNFPPAILSDSTCSLKGGILHCVCRAEARPNATLHWSINGSSTLPSSFTSITIYRENMVSAELTGPVERGPNVSCVASNSLATDIQQLPLDTKFTAGQFLPWMLTALAVVSVFLWGAVMFVRRIRCRERPKASSNLPTLDIPLRQPVPKLKAMVVRSGVILSVYIITFLIGLPGNILALYAFSVKIHNKPTPTDILLLNLTVSDLIFLLFLPLKMYEAASGMVWTLPRLLCNVTSFVFFSTIYTSSLLLMVVSVDRYLCVAFPVQYRLRRKPLYGVVSSLVVWVFSSVHLCFIYIVENQTSSDLYACYNNFTQEQLKVVLPMRLELCVVLYIVPLLVCVFCYLNFILILNRTPNLCAEKRKRAVGMAVGTLLVFIVCFLPYNVTHVQGFIIQDNVEWRLYALLLTTVNTILDPVTFYFSSSMFQATMKRILTGKRRNSTPGVFMTAQNNTRDIEGHSNPATTEGGLSDK